ncbi:hypothetical protein CR513_15554, partial [Mucuna pruriens]
MVHGENGKDTKPPPPLIIHFDTTANTLKPLVIQVPSPFLYKNSKAVVPWKYDVVVQSETPTVTNIAKMGGGMIRSGRENPTKEKHAEILIKIRKRKAKLLKKSKMKKSLRKKLKSFLNSSQSNYKLIDQLNQTLLAYLGHCFFTCPDFLQKKHKSTCTLTLRNRALKRFWNRALHYHKAHPIGAFPFLNFNLLKII